jgi:Holliday junction DNA helicase RuvB
MRDEGILMTDPLPEEERDEVTLRPRHMEDFIGQAALKERLAILIEAAQQRGESVDHVLFSGPPGLGKTSLAGILAVEMGAHFQATSGPALERPGDLAAVITNLERGDVLFIDEIHRLPRQVEEVLYPAMEDFQLDIVVGKGPAARSIRLDLPPFTLVGATTRVGRVAPPLRDRFGYVARLDYYDSAELGRIVGRSAEILEVEVTADGADTVSLRSRGTPRIANRLLRRVRDFAAVRSNGVVDRETALRALEVFEVDAAGLDKVDRAILEAIIIKFGGGPVGLSTLAIAVGEESETVEDAYEPYLLQEGFIQRTPRGRIATAHAYAHLGVAPQEPGGQGSLLP